MMDCREFNIRGVRYRGPVACPSATSPWKFIVERDAYVPLRCGGLGIKKVWKTYRLCEFPSQVEEVFHSLKAQSDYEKGMTA